MGFVFGPKRCVAQLRLVVTGGGGGLLDTCNHCSRSSCNDASSTLCQSV